MVSEITESLKVHVTLKTGHTIASASFGKEESVVDIDLQEAVGTNISARKGFTNRPRRRAVLKDWGCMERIKEKEIPTVG
ncbi:hypothetical protein FRC20_009418 [Serendipita sp. 405]|nr:hypothetical protein FRC15_009468 [Serendipita sp. 397]KAG8865862.1 hypothetical protein FRC20_009418 [Serendipita sp. 405]